MAQLEMTITLYEVPFAKYDWYVQDFLYGGDDVIKSIVLPWTNNSVKVWTALRDGSGVSYRWMDETRQVVYESKILPLDMGDWNVLRWMEGNGLLEGFGLMDYDYVV